MEPISKPDDIRLIEQLRVDYVRAQTQFALVLQEMEEELKRMRQNDRVPQDLIDKKDEQIEMLIRFNNRVEDLFGAYKMSNLTLRVELMAVHKMLWEAIKSGEPAFNALMHDLVKLPK